MLEDETRERGGEVTDLTIDRSADAAGAAEDAIGRLAAAIPEEPKKHVDMRGRLPVTTRKAKWRAVKDARRRNRR